MTLEPRDVVVTVFAAAESSMAEADAVIEADRRAAKLEVLRELGKRARAVRDFASYKAMVADLEKEGGAT